MAVRSFTVFLLANVRAGTTLSERVVTVAYFALVNLRDQNVQAASDAEHAAWFDAEDAPRLAFDHEAIIRMALARLKNKIRYCPSGFSSCCHDRTCARGKATNGPPPATPEAPPLPLTPAGKEEGPGEKRLPLESHTMHRLTPADYRQMPWRNGRGTTTEILVEPSSDIAIPAARFHYRLSIADITTNGPFSRFDGYDRHIMLLSGAGMTLDCGAHGRIDLLAPFEPRSFSGDWDVHGSLVAGPVRDFNLIVDRARASSSLGVRLLDAPETLAFDSGTICIVHVITGALADAAQGDTFVADAPFDLVPQGTTRVAIAHIVR